METNLENINGGRWVAHTAWFPLLASMALAVVFYALFRSEPFPVYFSASDKVGHFLGFCLLLIIVRGALYSKIHFSLIVLPLLALAVGSELVQASAWLPERSYSVADMAANVGGLFVGLILSVSIRKS